MYGSPVQSQGFFGNLFGRLLGRTGSYAFPSPTRPVLSPELVPYWEVARNNLGTIGLTMGENGTPDYGNNIQISKNIFSTPSATLVHPHTGQKWTFEFYPSQLPNGLPTTGIWKPYKFLGLFGGKTRKNKKSKNKNKHTHNKRTTRQHRRRMTRKHRYA